MSVEKGGSATQAVWTAFGLIVGSAVVLKIYPFLLALFSALLIGLALSFPVEFLQKRLRIPRGLGLLLTLVVLVGALAGAILLLTPTVTEQTTRFIGNLPTSARSAALQIADLTARLPMLSNIHEITSELARGTLPEPVANLLSKAANQVLAVAYTGINGAITLVAVLVIAVYIAGWPGDQKSLVLRFFPHEHRQQASVLIHRIVRIEQQFLAGQVLVMLTLGLLTAFGLWVAGIDYWLLFGLLTGLLSFIPYLGVLSSLLPPLLVGLSIDPAHAVYVLIVFAIVQSMEGYVVSPLIMKRHVELPPVLTVVAIIIAGELLGFWGMLLAIPLVAGCMALLDELYGSPDPSPQQASKRATHAIGPADKK